MNILWLSGWRRLAMITLLASPLFASICVATSDLDSTKIKAHDGDPVAQFKLAWRLENGIDVTRDDAAARLWYGRAAEQGHTEAQANLGSLFYTGRGGPKDFEHAFQLTDRAARSGLAIAQHNLAVMYMTGHGVAIDEDEATEWMESAAKQGHAPAMTKLAKLLANPDSVRNDPVLALTWALMADRVIQSDESNRLLKELESHLQPAQIVEAERHANHLESVLSR